MKVPTDLKILEYIYNEYYNDYSTYVRGDNTRSTKIFVPISIPKIAKHFKVDDDIIFGRFYYYLDPKYSFWDLDKTKKAFFHRGTDEKEKHCVNFPLLSSVLAELQYENKKYRTSTLIAFSATVIAALSIIVSLVL
jgi:hypothetical protein